MIVSKSEIDELKNSPVQVGYGVAVGNLEHEYNIDKTKLNFLAESYDNYLFSVKRDGDVVFFKVSKHTGEITLKEIPEYSYNEQLKNIKKKEHEFVDENGNFKNEGYITSSSQAVPSQKK